MSDTHTCSCGRTFGNEQILKYHQRVSKHAPAEGGAVAAVVAEAVAPVVAPVTVVEAPVAAPVLVSDAYELALEALEIKRAEQAAYERKLAQARLVNEFVEFAGDVATQSARVGVRAVGTGLVAGRKLMLRLMFALALVLVTAGLVTVGMGVGSAVANATGSGVATTAVGGLVSQS